MFSHPDSDIALGIVRHQELQAENVKLRLAMAAVAPRLHQPGVLNRTRIRLGSVLIRMGTSLHAQVQNGERNATLEPFHASVS
jgi:hypothetical protein